jgi:hypothetical protein
MLVTLSKVSSKRSDLVGMGCGHLHYIRHEPSPLADTDLRFDEIPFMLRFVYGLSAADGILH